MSTVIQYVQDLYAGVTLWSVVIYLLLLFITWWLYRILIYPWISPYRHIKGPRCYNPIFGNMLEALKGESVEFTMKWIEKYGPILRYHFFFGKERVVVADAEALKYIFVTNSNNWGRGFSITPGVFTRLVGDSVIAKSGVDHTRRRKILNPAFKMGVIKKMVPVLQLCTNRFIDMWSSRLCKGDGQLKVDICAELSRITLDNIGLCGFGYDFGTITDASSEPAATFNKVLSFAGLSLKSMIPGFHKLPLKDNLQVKKDIGIIDELVYQMIREKSSVDTDSDKQRPNKDLLDLLFDARKEAGGEELTTETIRDEVVALMLAGYETTSTAMMWTLYMLAKHPQIQQRAREEAKAILPSDKEDISSEDLDKLTYITSVIKETLRLYPPVALTLRASKNDDYLPGGVFIPAGTCVIAHVGAMMRLPENYKDPLTFNPDRFSDDTLIDPYKFMPFISGPYMCIGYKFALMEIKLIIAMLLKTFTFDCDRNAIYRKTTKITLKTKPPIELIVSK